MATPAYESNNHNSNNPVYAKHRSKKRSRHKKRRSLISRFFKWASLNPGKLIGILCACVIIYVSILFYRYYKEQRALNKNHASQVD
ncbi:MAG: hypothetical protein ABI416_11620 [Ginsengibacter sp.]